MSILVNKKSNYTGSIDEEKLKDYLSDVDQDIQNLFQMSAPITFGYGSSNNILVSQGGWTWSVSGYLGGWNVTGNLLYAGTASTYIGLQPGVGIWAGDEAFLSGAFSVDPNGVVKAHSGDIGGWNLSASRLYSTNILIDSSNEYIRTVNYASGALGAGWNIDNTLAEFNNIRARGKIVTSVFEKDTVSTVGGNLLVSDSDILNADMGTADNSTLTISGDTTFAVGDFLRIKDGVGDEWFQVSNIASAPIYTVTRDKAGAYTANQNPAWKKGTCVANFGTSGEGVVFMTASESNAPYLSIVTHEGTPWTSLSTKVRLGNLNGFMDYSTDKYGIAMGSGNANLVIDEANGIRIRKNLTDLVTIDTAGNAYFASTVRIGGVSGAYASTVNGWAHSSDVTKLDGGDLYVASVTTSALNSDAINRFFSNPTVRTNIEAWTAAGDATLIDGGKIYANSILIAKLGSDSTNRLFTDSTTKTNIEAWKSATDVTLIDGGDIYAGSSITIGSSGLIKSGQTAYNNGTGWWMGDVSGTPKFSIGNSASAKTLTWNGTTLAVSNIQSPDYVADTSGYLLTADSGLLINTGKVKASSFVGSALGALEITTSGNFIVPEGVTKLFLFMCGGGGGGGNTDLFAGGGGSSAVCLNGYPYITTAGTIAVTIGTGGASFSNGGNSIFGSVTCAGGTSGGQGDTALGKGGVISGGIGFSMSGFSAPVVNTGGNGGSSLFGSGGTGSPAQSAGAPGTGYGAGGGGGSKPGSGGSDGGEGSDGYCLVLW